MSQARRVLVLLTGVLPMLLVTGCTRAQDGPTEDAESWQPKFDLGFKETDDSDRGWPARGSLVGDREVLAEVEEVLEGWQTPEGREVEVGRSELAWVGEVDGIIVAIVDARLHAIPGGSWFVEVVGERGQLEVSDARQYPGLSFPSAHEVVPVRSPQVGQRYLVSERVESLAIAGTEVPLDQTGHGMTGVVDVPACESSEVVAGRLDRFGGGVYQYVDLGTGVPERLYPLLRVGPGVDAAVLENIDTCSAGGSGDWLGSVLELLGDDSPAELSAAERLASVDAEELRGTFEGFALWGAGRIGASAPLVAEVVVWRPEDGAPVVSRAQKEGSRPRFFPLVVDGLAVAVMTYYEEGERGRRPTEDIEVPSEVTVLWEEPGVLLMSLPDHPVEISYTLDGEREQVTVEAP